ncbi:MAG: gamma-glutamyltransferase [Hyphomicrobiaceae bacterium]|nr:gamma-glutamyltransferase [Hyphomicrobiaceae bacterium]MCC0009368.1 gamma-glutamyltransferase [Hyphomicrobiaceae bacterium]
MTKGIVAAGHEATAGAAAEILGSGGNAFDAAIAGLFAACIAEPVLASPGGGGFLMGHDPDADGDVLYDFFVDTPRRKRQPQDVQFFGVEVDFGPAKQEFHVGLGAAATPGFIPGLFAIHRAHGSLAMSDLVGPAIRAARDGVIVNAFQGYLFSITAPIYALRPDSAAVFAPGGIPLREGDELRNPLLAETLSLLATQGELLFRDGEVGREIIRQSANSGGHIDAADLAGYQVERRAPLVTRHNGADVVLNPAPAASGPLIAFSLRLLESLAGNRPPTITQLADVMEQTNEARRTHGTTPERLKDADILAAHLAEISGRAQAYRGTTHISVIDSDGRAAAATVSNGEGNGFFVGPYGFMLNNMLGEEDLNPDGFGLWNPGERMSSMMAPTIIRTVDGRLIALGSGGSNRIRTAILQVAINMIDRGMRLADAVKAPRLHVEKCGTASYEEQFGTEAISALRTAFPDARAWPEPNMFFGGVHAVALARNGIMAGAGDPRRAGVVVAVE